MRKKLEEIQIKDHNSSELPKRYTELITNFKPVMRHYFTEKHREPMAWFSMRLNYIRSVAVTSIVGHILGIGDRHCSNILIDKLTGELVHIDFGIVFEDVSLHIIQNQMGFGELLGSYLSTAPATTPYPKHGVSLT